MNNVRVGDKVMFIYYLNEEHKDVSFGVVTEASYGYVYVDCKECGKNHIRQPHEVRVYRKSLAPKAKHYGKMKKLSLIAKRLLDKDLRDLVKAEILNEELAVEDTDFVLAFVVTKYKKELAVEARRFLKGKKKCKDEDDDDE
jgi:hypothetical protein